MEALLRKYVWALDLAVVAICAIFLGRAASSLVESKLLTAEGTPRPPRHAVRTAASTVYSKDVDDILKRNIFCSTCPPIIKPPETDQPETTPEPQKTTQPLALVAIMYAPPPNGLVWSRAVIRDTETKGIGSYSTGSKVHDSTITSIEDVRVYLDNAGKPEYIDLQDAPTNTAGAPVAVAAAPSVDPLTAEMDRGIKKISENLYEIQRATLDAVLGNISMLSRAARIVPEIRDGRAAGFRLYSVRPDGPFAKIGMQNGDILSGINGLELTSPEKALEVYSKLKSASHLSLTLERNGQKVTKDYNIR